MDKDAQGRTMNDMLGELYEGMDINEEGAKLLKELEDKGEILTLATNPNHGKVGVQLVNESDNPTPEYSSKGASGFDFRANLGEPITLKPLGRAMVPTGLKMKLPENIELQVRPRSGLAAKNGITVLNSPGTVDSDYIGEIKVILINLGSEDFTINHGDRIAQGVFAHSGADNLYYFSNVDSLAKTDRGEDGLGSTGIN